jgi:hypothetical protein
MIKKNRSGQIERFYEGANSRSKSSMANSSWRVTIEIADFNDRAVPSRGGNSNRLAR